MLSVVDEDEFERLKQEHDLLVAYFTTNVCAVGESVFPRVVDLMERLDRPLTVIDTVALPTISGQHTVFAVPTLVIFVFGREVDRFSRIFSLADVEAALNRAVAIVEEA